MGQERVELVCPHCHAPLPERASSEVVRCAYCGVCSAPAPQQVIVQRVIVPVEVMAPADGRPTPAAGLPCPYCSRRLVETRVHDVALFGCGACGGIWMDNDAGKRLEAHPDAAIEDLAESAWESPAAQTARKFRADAGPRQLACPVCATPLSREAGPGGAKLDRCVAHGVWFDGHELTVVVRECARRQAAAMEQRRREEQAALAQAAAEAPPPDTASLYGRGAVTLLRALASALTSTHHS
jgi:Zn-finger nucleic acid-binding protein